MRIWMQFGILLFCYSILATPQANAGRCCFCEIGQFPSSQQVFFKQGCRSWLSQQTNCTSKQIVPHGFSYANADLACVGGELNIGYVGHWSSSEETLNYLDFVIVPAMREQEVSVKIDNTACRGMDDPALVQTYIRSIASEGEISPSQNLTVHGNQVISVGAWDRLIGPNYNFWAMASSAQEQPSYPHCNQFENKACLLSEQNGEEGLCVDARGSKQRLRCCRVPDQELGSGYSFAKRYAWSDPQTCL